MLAYWFGFIIVLFIGRRVEIMFTEVSPDTAVNVSSFAVITKELAIISATESRCFQGVEG